MSAGYAESLSKGPLSALLGAQREPIAGILEGVAALLGRLTPRARIWIEIDGAIGLSQWHVALLEAVEATGSLAQAAEKLDTPIRTARRKLREIEGHLGLRLLTRQRGAESGPLTPEARELLARWRFFSACWG